jgi:hypothetical protein
MRYVYDRLAKLEEFKENFERYTAPIVDQAQHAADEFYDFRDDYNSKASFEFVDVTKN